MNYLDSETEEIIYDQENINEIIEGTLDMMFPNREDNYDDNSKQNQLQ